MDVTMDVCNRVETHATAHWAAEPQQLSVLSNIKRLLARFAFCRDLSSSRCSQDKVLAAGAEHLAQALFRDLNANEGNFGRLARIQLPKSIECVSNQS